ncbi:Ubiquitin carboxyl-terminal hydrolase 36 [Frankliniella fusca]|uniref:Ubiquitin carboxyl-terminal hydrolase 36 n=1 Tax=Frankliniella fusca TaxID=407009 RepID=A0AAE1LTF4_9NEOP|nr:Ubiquitin carboxyl-terminal hydrolase 36 [Frankliniella fusca]
MYFAFTQWVNSEPPGEPRMILYRAPVTLGWQQTRGHHDAGLVNLINSCYLNATIQVLFHIPAFARFLIEDGEHRQSCVSSSCIACCLFRLYDIMSTQSVAVPLNVYNMIQAVCPQMQRGHQEDAHELLVKMLELLEQQLLKRHPNWESLDYPSTLTTAVGKIFGGILKSSVYCPSCKTENSVFNQVTTISPDLQGPSTLQGIVTERGEKITDYTCRNCKASLSEAEKRETFHAHPKVLVVLLKRYKLYFDLQSEKFERSFVAGIPSHVKNESPITISKSVVVGMARYKFIGGIIHKGPTIHNGHYVSVALCPNGHYSLFDDPTVTRNVSLNTDVCKKGLYVAVLELESMIAEKRSSPSPSPLPKTNARSILKDHLKPKHVAPALVKISKKNECKTHFFQSSNEYSTIRESYHPAAQVSKAVLPLHDNISKTSGFKEGSSQSSHENNIVEEPFHPNGQISKYFMAATQAVSPIHIRISKRTEPKEHSSQSSHDYAIMEETLNQFAENSMAVSPIHIKISERTEPKEHSSQSSHDYAIVQETFLETQISKAVSPIHIKISERTEPKEHSSQSSHDYAIVLCIKGLPLNVAKKFVHTAEVNGKESRSIAHNSNCHWVRDESTTDISDLERNRIQVNKLQGVSSPAYRKATQTTCFTAIYLFFKTTIPLNLDLKPYTCVATSPALSSAPFRSGHQACVSIPSGSACTPLSSLADKLLEVLRLDDQEKHRKTSVEPVGWGSLHLLTHLIPLEK